jgi:microcystin-dependent protein
MANTPNKGLLLMVTGTEVDTWGDELNDEVFTPLDSMLGGVVTKSLTNVQVDLTADESENLRLVLNGTLTGNVLVTTQCVGFTIVENQCTGAFTVTFQKNGVGTPVTVPNGTNNLVTTGLAGNPAVVGIDFPAGTRIPFQQTTPPPGYSKDTATVGLNNSAMRLVTGSVVNGGTEDFSTTFANRTPAGTVGDTTLSTTQIPAHSHLNVAGATVSTTGTPGASEYIANRNSLGTTTQIGGTATVATGGRSTDTGGGQPHNHSLTMNAMNFAVRYFDFCIGVKQ